LRLAFSLLLRCCRRGRRHVLGEEVDDRQKKNSSTQSRNDRGSVGSSSAAF
jgi:hypothetical protein